MIKVTQEEGGCRDNDDSDEDTSKIIISVALFKNFIRLDVL